MLCYRIALGIHNNLNNALSGIGGHHAEGRWHYMGVSVVYTGSTRSLAILERLVNDSTDILSINLAVTTILIPDNIKIMRVSETELPAGWNDHPYNQYTQKLGTDWLKKAESAVIQLPSSVCIEEYNFIINPEHPEAAQITVVNCKPFTYPDRLVAKL